MALDWAVGQLITATRLNRRLPIHVVSTGTVNLASDATLNDSTELILNLLANVTYWIRGALYISTAANAAGDFQYGWTWTNSGSVYRSSFGLADTLASGSTGDEYGGGFLVDTTSPAAGVGFGASTSTNVVQVNDKFVTGGSDVVLTLTWAQQNSNVNNTTLALGSWLTAIPIA